MKSGLQLLIPLLCLPTALLADFRAGTAKIDVTPREYPVLVNGGMTSRTTDTATGPIHARAVVLDDGDTRLAIVVVDSCMMPRPLLDRAKALAAERTEIAPDHILIAATHTHSAPSVFGCLGTRADLKYSAQLIEQLAEAIQKAEAALQPAKVGWASTLAPDYTALRRWVRRPDRVAEDPFGNATVRANMHAGKNLDDVTGETGPEDPELSAVVIQTTEGEPIAFIANFSMHYFSGVKPVNADYFGLFCDHVEAKLGGGLALMTHGCSGDIWRRDYRTTDWVSPQIDDYSRELGELILGAAKSTSFQTEPDLKMAERRIPLSYRVPTKERLEWAKGVVSEMGDRDPKNKTEVYANEAVELHLAKETRVVVQALRIGDIAIVSTPNETYALTGLKFKLQSPTAHTMTLDLTNGADGYIPPPEQHLLGGYNTWPARSAGLEVLAEPKIVATGLELLETVTGRPRVAYLQSKSEKAKNILAAKPLAWWRLDEFGGNLARDSSGNGRNALFEQPVLPFLEGTVGFTQGNEKNRATHFAGGRLHSRLPSLGENWTAVVQIWNGMPIGSRKILGWFLSRDENHGLTERGVHLGLNTKGLLILQRGRTSQELGPDAVPRWTWAEVKLVAKGRIIDVYLNGEHQLTSEGSAANSANLFIGGRSDGEDGWEGRLDEVAIFHPGDF